MNDVWWALIALATYITGWVVGTWREYDRAKSWYVKAGVLTYGYNPVRRTLTGKLYHQYPPALPPREFVAMRERGVRFE